MPKLPSGLIAGIVTSNASLRANQQGFKVTTSTELSMLYSLVDVVYSRGNSMQQWKKNTYFSGYTLADTNLFDTWEKKDQAVFWKWINTDDLNTYFCNLRDDLSKQSDHQVKLTNIPLPCRLYSLLHNKITNIKLDKASAEQWIGTINNLCSNGLTKDELEYTEIKQWITKQNTAISKSDLLKKIEQSLPEIKLYQEIKTEPIPLNFIPCGWLLSEERTKMITSPDYYAIVRYINPATNYKIILVKNRKNIGIHHWMVLDPDNKVIVRLDDPSFPFPKALQYTTKNAAIYAATYDAWNRKLTKTKEVNYGRFSHELLSGGTDYQELLLVLQNRVDNYYSKHFPIRNLLVHIRTKIRTDSNGNRLLFIEEIQSDWLQSISKTSNDENVETNSSVPYKKDWYGLALKIALMQAAQLNLDGIGWTPGRVHEKRYRENLKGLMTFYDDIFPKYIIKLTKPWGGTIVRTYIKTKGQRLYLSQSELTNKWAVKDKIGIFRTKHKFSRGEACIVRDSHSRNTTVKIHTFLISEAFRSHILEKGLSLFGATQNHIANESIVKKSEKKQATTKNNKAKIVKNKHNNFSGYSQSSPLDNELISNKGIYND